MRHVKEAKNDIEIELPKPSQNIKYFGEKKLKNTWKYWQQTPLNKRRKNNIPAERENYFETKQYNRNLIKGINNRAVPVIRYSENY